MPASVLNQRALCLAVLGCAGAVAQADIVDELYKIDSFRTQFLGEKFVSSYSNGIANSLYIRNGLEVGNILLGEGYEPGDAHPGWIPREQEIQHQTNLSDVLGGVRHGNLLATSALGSDVHVNVGSDRLSFNTAFGTQAKLDLTYDGGGQLNHDFSSIINGAFRITLLNGDLYYPQYGNLRPVPISVQLTSGLGTTNEQSFEVGSTLLESGVDHRFNFDDFLGIDLGDVDRISLKIDQSDEALKAVDFSIGSFDVVGTPSIPAPASVAILAAGGLFGMRRRRSSP